jgi:hypothetical protein
MRLGYTLSSEELDAPSLVVESGGQPVFHA